jgi:hypothetical protein
VFELVDMLMHLIDRKVAEAVARSTDGIEA